jgi:signal peptidase II
MTRLKLTSEAARAKTLSIIWLIIMLIGSIGVDQVSKLHAQNALMQWQDEKDPALYQGQRYPLFTLGNPVGEGTTFVSMSFNYVRNLGAAWGALSHLPDSTRVPFFYAVTVLAVIIIGLYIRSTPVNHRLAIFALSLILSGAIGNFIDRFRLGYVIDWIDVRWDLFGWRYDFPNFNFADSCITVGVTLLMIDMIILEAIRKKRASHGNASSIPAAHPA